MNNSYEDIVIEIIKEQEMIIGPVAVEQVSTVKGILLDWKTKHVELSGDPKEVIDKLVEQYRQLFGQISVEVCKEAATHAAGSMPHDQLPKSLQ